LFLRYLIWVVLEGGLMLVRKGGGGNREREK